MKLRWCSLAVLLSACVLLPQVRPPDPASTERVYSIDHRAPDRATAFTRLEAWVEENWEFSPTRRPIRHPERGILVLEWAAVADMLGEVLGSRGIIEVDDTRVVFRFFALPMPFDDRMPDESRIATLYEQWDQIAASTPWGAARLDRAGYTSMVTGNACRNIYDCDRGARCEEGICVER